MCRPTDRPADVEWPVEPHVQTPWLTTCCVSGVLPPHLGRALSRETSGTARSECLPSAFLKPHPAARATVPAGRAGFARARSLAASSGPGHGTRADLICDTCGPINGCRAPADLMFCEHVVSHSETFHNSQTYQNFLTLRISQVQPTKICFGLRSMRCFARPLLARSRSFWRLLAPRKSGHVWLRACDGVSSKSVHWPQQNTARAHGVSRQHTFPREKQFPLRGDREAGSGLPSCI